MADQGIYYSNLLASEYINKARANATVYSLATEAQADGVLQNVLDGFNIVSYDLYPPYANIPTAIGTQLHILAKIRNVPIELYGLVIGKTFMAVPSYDDGAIAGYSGLGTYEGGVPDDYFMTYEDANQPTYAFDDTLLAQLIRFKASVDSSPDHSDSEIDLILSQYFGNNVAMTDNMDMTMTIHQTLSGSSAFRQLLFRIVDALGFFPQPAGVALTVTTA